MSNELEFKQEQTWRAGPKEEYEVEYCSAMKCFRAIFWGKERELNRLGDWPDFNQAREACQLHATAWDGKEMP